MPDNGTTGMVGNEEIHGDAQVGGSAVTFNQQKTLPDIPTPRDDAETGMSGTEEIHGEAAVGGSKVTFSQ